MKKFILILILMLLMNQAEANCNKYLSTENLEATATTTDRFIAYVNKLLSERMIALSQLQGMLEKLENSQQITNPISQSSINSDNKIHFQALQDYIDSKELDQQKIISWTKVFLAEQKTIKKEQDKVKEKLIVPAISMQFYPVSPGEIYEYGLKIEHPFEMTSTPITQHMWVKQIKANPSRVFDSMPNTRDDFPVQNISWWSALAYANEVSKSAGLPEVYDLSSLTYVKGSMGGGDLEYRQEPVKINAPDGDIYKAKGYRLPTVAEIKYLQTLSIIADNGSAAEAEEYFGGNVNNFFYPVAEIKPFVLENSVFYDLFGHISYFTSDYIIKSEGTFYAILAKGYYVQSFNRKFKKVFTSNNLSPEYQDFKVGIRLVRSLSKP